MSTNRAFSVKAMLEEFGVDGKRILAKGYGPNKPLADNKTEEGRAKNRRVEIVIVANDKMVNDAKQGNLK